MSDALKETVGNGEVTKLEMLCSTRPLIKSRHLGVEPENYIHNKFVADAADYQITDLVVRIDKDSHMAVHQPPCRTCS